MLIFLVSLQRTVNVLQIDIQLDGKNIILEWDMDDWICLFTYTLWRYLLILHGCLGNHIFFIQRHLIIADSAYPGPDMIFLQKILPGNPYIPLPPKSLTRGLFELSPLDYTTFSDIISIQCHPTLLMSVERSENLFIVEQTHAVETCKLGRMQYY